MATTQSHLSQQNVQETKKQGLKAPSIQLLIIFYLISLAFVLGTTWPWPRDPDIWWHLKTGQWVLSHQAVPWSDPFGANTQGVQWIAYSWLAEILFHGIEQAQPIVGLNLLQGLIFAATIGILLFHAFARSGSFRSAILLTSVFLVPMTPWVARPQIFSFLFTALTMLILWWGQHRNAKVLWLLPLLIVLWANIHVYFIVGFGLIALHFLEAWKKLPEQRRSYFFLLLLCILAPLLNPYGIHLYQEVFLLAKHASEGWEADVIRELASPNFHDWPMKIFFVWVVLQCAILMMSEKRVSLVTLILFIGLLHQAFQHVRDIPYFVIIMLPILADHLTQLPWQKWRDFFQQGRYSTWLRLSVPKGLIHWVVACGVIPAMLVLPYRILHYPTEYRRTEMTGAVEYLLKAKPSGPLYHSLNWGGYFIYALTPLYKVYIDGRTQLYSRKFWEANDRIRFGRSDWESQLDKTGARTVVWKKDDPLASLLQLSPHWTLAWSDKHVVIFVKCTPWKTVCGIN